MSEIEYTGNTVIKTTNFNFSWKIHNFSWFNMKNFDDFSSPNFLDPHLNCTWGCELYKGRFNDDHPEKGTVRGCGLRLELRQGCNENVNKKALQFQYNILDDNLEKIHQGSFEGTINNQCYENVYDGGNDRKHNLLNIIGEERCFKTLTIDCYLTIAHDYDSIGSIPQFGLSYHSDVCNDLENILKEKDLSDFTLVVDGKELHVHKVILAARSSYFLAMFKHNTIKKNENKMTITDGTVNEIQEMLYFIYTGKTKNIDKVAFNLLSISDKYGIQKLKEICAMSLFKNLSANNALKTLIFAQQHNCSQLENVAFNFIVNNKIQILKSDDFKELAITNPHLLNKVLIRLL